MNKSILVPAVFYAQFRIIPQKNCGIFVCKSEINERRIKMCVKKMDFMKVINEKEVLIS